MISYKCYLPVWYFIFFNTFYLILYIFLNFRLFLCALPKFWFHILLHCLQIIMFFLCIFEVSYFLHSICLKLKQSNLLLSSFQTICAWQTWPCLLSAPDHFIQFDVLCMIETQWKKNKWKHCRKHPNIVFLHYNKGNIVNKNKEWNKTKYTN